MTRDRKEIAINNFSISYFRLRLSVRNIPRGALSRKRKKALLAENDVGLIPWIPLTQWTGPPEELLRTCRERIVNDGPPREVGNLLAATRTMAEMRYNDFNLLKLLEEIPMTMEKVYNASPFIQRLCAEIQGEGLRLTSSQIRYGVSRSVLAICRATRQRASLA